MKTEGVKNGVSFGKNENKKNLIFGVFQLSIPFTHPVFSHSRFRFPLTLPVSPVTHPVFSTHASGFFRARFLS